MDRERRPKKGIVVRNFIDLAVEQLSTGSVELRSAEPSYDDTNPQLHTLSLVRSVLERLERQQPAVRCVEPFADILAFDAWVGIGDRHQENWGVVRTLKGEPLRLAPIFDVASCLGTELIDSDHRLAPGADLARYVRECPSGFGDGGPTGKRRLRPMIEVVDELSRWPEWERCGKAWVAAFKTAMDTWTEDLRCVPTAWLPANRADLARRLLALRLDWLTARLPSA